MRVFFGRDGSRVGLVIGAAFAATAIGSAYLPLFLADRGLSAAEIGQVLGAASLLRMGAGPVGGWVADRLGRPAGVVAVAATGAALGAAALPGLHGFVPLLLATAGAGMSSALIGPLTDAIALGLARVGRLDYGPTRAWGSISYMAATAGTGALLARTGSGAVPVLVAAAYGVTALAALRMRVDVVARARGSVGAVCRALFRDRAFLWALLATALIQGSHAAYYAFAPLHWRSAGVPDAAIGLLIAEGVVAEVALFLWGRRLVERLGPARLTALAATACVVRWTGLALVTDWPWLVALQLLHAGTFAFQHLSTMSVLRGLPPGRAGMAQTLMSAVGYSASTAVLVWLSGQLYGPWGGGVFLPMALVGGLGWLTVPGLRQAARA